MPHAIDPAVEARPTTVRDARLHVLAAWRERHNGEDHAAGWAVEYRRQAASGSAVVYARAEAARFADLDNAPKAARKIRGAARLLARRRQGALPLLRQALAIVRANPLPEPETDNEAIERHLDLALAFLARPRVV